MKVKYPQVKKQQQRKNQTVSNEGPNGWPKPDLLKSALEIVFVTIFIPALVVGIIIFSVEDFALFNAMEPLILEWWRELF